MNNKFKDDQVDYLFRCIMTLDTLEECYNFFEDLCTISELQEMAKRMHAAKMLRENYIYSEISEQTGLSTATISRVNRCMKYGSDGYITAIERMKRRRGNE